MVIRRTVIFYFGAAFALAAAVTYAAFAHNQSLPQQNAHLDIVSAEPALSDEELLGIKTVSEAKLKAIALHRVLILARIASGKPLSLEEKQTIGVILLNRSQLYHFTDLERDAIFKALSATNNSVSTIAGTYAANA